MGGRAVWAPNGGLRTVVPALRDISVDRAVDVLAARGLVARLPAMTISSEQTRVGGVSDPASGSRVSVGTIVAVHPTYGVLGSTGCAVDPPAVPDVVGLTLSDAMALIQGCWPVTLPPIVVRAVSLFSAFRVTGQNLVPSNGSCPVVALTVATRKDLPPGRTDRVLSAFFAGLGFDRTSSYPRTASSQAA